MMLYRFLRVFIAYGVQESGWESIDLVNKKACFEKKRLAPLPIRLLHPLPASSVLQSCRKHMDKVTSGSVSHRFFVSGVGGSKKAVMRGFTWLIKRPDS